jgi:hypothetical protein
MKRAFSAHEFPEPFLVHDAAQLQGVSVKRLDGARRGGRPTS